MQRYQTSQGNTKNVTSSNYLKKNVCDENLICKKCDGLNACLLEACKRIVSVYNFKKKCNEPFEMDDLAIEVLNDAIKKATGETL